MLRELEHLVNSFLPPIDPDAVRDLHEALNREGDIASRLFLGTADNDVRQGDIIGPLPFIFVQHDGRALEQDRLGLLVSQSCDYDHDEHVLVAPCIIAADYERASGRRARAANEKTDLMFIPGIRGLPDVVADLAKIQSLRTNFIRQRETEGRLRRSPSLSHAGYYFFLAKLTLHLLRPKGREELRSSTPGNIRERVRRVWLDLRCSAQQNFASFD